MGFIETRHYVPERMKATKFLRILGYSNAKVQKILDRKRLYQGCKLVRKGDMLDVGFVRLYDFVPLDLGLLPVCLLFYYKALDSKNKDFVIKKIYKKSKYFHYFYDELNHDLMDNFSDFAGEIFESKNLHKDSSGLRPQNDDLIKDVLRHVERSETSLIFKHNKLLESNKDSKDSSHSFRMTDLYRVRMTTLRHVEDNVRTVMLSESETSLQNQHLTDSSGLRPQNDGECHVEQSETSTWNIDFKNKIQKGSSSLRPQNDVKLQNLDSKNTQINSKNTKSTSSHSIQKQENMQKSYEIYKVCVFDKPPFLLTHPISLSDKKSLLDQVKFSFGQEANVCHRLDYDTSGLILCSIDKKSEIFFKNLFIQKKIFKEYIALLRGEIKECLLIESDITHKPRYCNLSIKGSSENEEIYPIYPSDIRHILKQKLHQGRATSILYPLGVYDSIYECNEVFDIFDYRDSGWINDLDSINFHRFFRREKFSLVKFIPISGKTHQLRIHARSIGAPICGDMLYGVNDSLANFFFDINKWREKAFYINAFESHNATELGIFNEFLSFFYKALDKNDKKMQDKILKNMRLYYTGTKRLMLHARKMGITGVSVFSQKSYFEYNSSSDW